MSDTGAAAVREVLRRLAGVFGFPSTETVDLIRSRGDRVSSRRRFAGPALAARLVGT